MKLGAPPGHQSTSASDVSLEESAWQRARRDVGGARHSLWFWVAEVAAAAFSVALTTPYLDEPAHSGVSKALVAGGAVVASAVAVLIAVLLFALFMAPYRQRDDARRRLREAAMALDAERESTIDALTAFIQRGDVIQRLIHVSASISRDRDLPPIRASVGS